MDSLRRIVRALRSSHRAAGNLNLTGAQLFVLSILASSEKPMSVGEVALLTQTDQSTVSVVVSRLVDRGLVKRERHAGDARRVELSLTQRGRSLHKRGPATLAQRRLTAALAQLSQRDASVLVRLLRFIVDEMGIGGEPPAMLFDDGKPERQRTAPKRRTRAVPRLTGA